MNRTSQTDRGTRFRALHFLVGLLAMSGTVAAQAPSAAPPRFDKAKIKSVAAAMTLDEKAALVVGEGGAFGPPPAPPTAGARRRLRRPRLTRLLPPESWGRRSASFLAPPEPPTQFHASESRPRCWPTGPPACGSAPRGRTTRAPTTPRRFPVGTLARLVLGHGSRERVGTGHGQRGQGVRRRRAARPRG